MARGGRRPNAGAPKGNFNRLSSGNASPRLRLVYLALLAWPDKRELALVLYRAGIIDGPRLRFDRRRLAPAADFLYHYFFIDQQEALATKSLKRPTVPTERED